MKTEEKARMLGLDLHVYEIMENDNFRSRLC